MIQWRNGATSTGLWCEACKKPSYVRSEKLAFQVLPSGEDAPEGPALFVAEGCPECKAGVYSEEAQRGQARVEAEA